MNTVYFPFLPFYIVLAACIGSFLNMLVWRLPRHESLMGRSHCCDCGHLLAPLDLIPVFSWLFLKGRCRYCRQPIAARYFWLEVCCIAAWTFCWFLSATPLALLISTCLITLALFFAVLFLEQKRLR
ncbi:MAG: prepilin peptidase [Negativicutes bacterium]|nr:prepilin peptidase [Negativicutes bacterium]